MNNFPLQIKHVITLQRFASCLMHVIILDAALLSCVCVCSELKLESLYYHYTQNMYPVYKKNNNTVTGIMSSTICEK